jgi:acetylornithine/succinyldiaminopimelate/putrescine aminotransferase
MYCSYTDQAVAHHAGLFHHFKEPVMITEGKMQYLFDEKGRRYLDVSS